MNRLLIILLTLTIVGCGTSEDNEAEKINYPNGFFPIKEYGEWGYINSAGVKVIKCQFEQALEFSEGFAPVFLDTLWGFIDTTGNTVIEPTFKRVKPFSCGLSNVTYANDTGIVSAFIKTDGSTSFISTYQNISPFAFDRATAEIDDEVWVIDKSGNAVFNTHYPYGAGSPLSEGTVRVWGGNGGWVQKGLSRVRRGDSTRYFNMVGKLIIEIEGRYYGDFKDGLALIKHNDSACYINKEGEIIVKPEKPDLIYSDFSNGLARVRTLGRNNKTGFIDKTGKIVIPLEYSNVYDFKEGVVAYRDSIYWGFINKTGDTVISPQFEGVDYYGFKNGLCKVEKDRQWGYINHKGEFVWKSQIDLQYKKLELSNWQLDTLEINAPMFGGKYAGRQNKAREIDFQTPSLLYLKIDTSDITVFEDKYYGYKVYLVNGANEAVFIPAQDGHIKLIQQAKNDEGQWQDIENFLNSFCGNSYHTVQLMPNYYQIYSAPVTNGDYKTTLRFRLELIDSSIYSNEYHGAIHKSQFLNPKDKDQIGIMVWTN